MAFEAKSTISRQLHRRSTDTADGAELDGHSVWASKPQCWRIFDTGDDMERRGATALSDIGRTFVDEIEAQVKDQIRVRRKSKVTYN